MMPNTRFWTSNLCKRPLKAWPGTEYMHRGAGHICVYMKVTPQTPLFSLHVFDQECATTRDVRCAHTGDIFVLFLPAGEFRASHLVGIDL